MTYATDQLMEEVAYVAYHLHWSLDSIIDLEHALRRRLIEEIDRIGRQAGARG